MVLALSVIVLGLGFAACDTGSEPIDRTKELDFPAGAGTRTFDVEAPDPSTHTWEVRITAPLAADLAVRVRTPNSPDLHVVTATQRDDANCRVDQSRRSCVFRFPALEARTPGTWTVVVTKRSQPPAEVSADLKFAPAS